MAVQFAFFYFMFLCFEIIPDSFSSSVWLATLLTNLTIFFGLLIKTSSFLFRLWSSVSVQLFNFQITMRM